MPRTVVDGEDVSELAQVETWRVFVLREAGYPSDLAEVLAPRTDIDLHRACDLLSAGCSVKTAMRILL